MQYSSKVIEEAVEQLASLPSIGRRSALRLVLSMLKRRPEEMERFARAFLELNSKIKYCKECHNISDEDTCSICNNPRRDKSLVCVVEDIRDVMAIENTRQFRGLYHVLGGIISPMDGTGPADLEIESLISRVAEGEVEEVIMALSSTMEGDTTNFYIFRKLKDFPVKVSTLARGVSVGDELEYADEVTLGRSILHRTPFEQTLQR
ncbi:MAG: recombination mediator RecR [Flavobacteriales bacterium]